MKINSTILMILAGGAALLYYMSQQGLLGTATATPLSIYPSLAWTAAPATTSMAATPAQKASTVVAPMSLYSSTQAQAQQALYAQCAGSYPGCTMTMADTQLGF